MGWSGIRCDLSHTPAVREEYVAKVAEYASANPDVEWILGGGWALAAFPGGQPTAAELDAALPGRPVFLPNRDHHGAWVSSRALELAGIDRTTPDPPDGRIERDASGDPSGMLQEGAMKLVTDHLPKTSDDELYGAFLEGQRYLHSLGVTGWQDAIVGEYAGMDDCGPTYAHAARSGDLTGWVVGALWWDRTRGLDQLADLIERRAGFSHGRFAATAVKIMQDGVAENGTAAMLAPYLDRCGHATDNTGHSFVDPELLKEYVAALDHEGFQVHVHGLGDRSVREALDAFVGTDPSRRHHIAHLQLVDPADVARFSALGVTGTIQALWACLDDQMVELTLPFLTEERAGHQYPFGDLVRAGAPLAAGSDWPVSTPDPLQAIHVAVHRTAYGESGPAGTEPFLPEQRLDLTTAFAAYTSGSARVNHRDEAGSIAPGKLADLVSSTATLSMILGRSVLLRSSRRGSRANPSTRREDRSIRTVLGSPPPRGTPRIYRRDTASGSMASNNPRKDSIMAKLLGALTVTAVLALTTTGCDHQDKPADTTPTKAAPGQTIHIAVLGDSLAETAGRTSTASASRPSSDGPSRSRCCLPWCVPDGAALVTGSPDAVADADIVIVQTGFNNAMPDPETGIGCSGSLGSGDAAGLLRWLRSTKQPVLARGSRPMPASMTRSLRASRLRAPGNPRCWWR